MGRALLISTVAFIAGFLASLPWIHRETERQVTEAKKLQRRITLLKEENDRLHSVVSEAERAKTLAANRAQREAVERDVVAIRGLPFKTPVDYQVLNRQEIKETISDKLAAVFSEVEFRNMTAALSVLGLLPENYPLREKYIDLLGEQVAAFYDQHQHKLFMFEDASLADVQNRVVLAHELTHALQDQYFGLKRLPLEIKTNDDSAVAASALVEGEATMVMSEYMLKNISLSALKDDLFASIGQNMDQLNKAPRFLREMLIFPYLRGQEFCAAIAGGDYEAVNKVYEHPPSSTSQILHPEKYRATPREEPLDVEWPDRTAKGEQPIADNVVGEMAIRILIGEWVDDLTGEKAAAGWRGDRYLCFDGGKGLVWKSCWANAQEADEFLAAEAKVLARRSDRHRVTDLKKVNDTTVVLIDAADEGWARELKDRFLQ